MKGLPFVLISACLCFALNSCKRSGCTDVKALNYDAKAKKDDMSCEYMAKIHLWLSYSTADSLSFSYPMRIYLRHNQIGVWNEGDRRAKEPYSCVEEKGTLLRVDRFKLENSSAVLQLFNQKGEVVYEKTLTNLKGGECRKVKI